MTSEFYRQTRLNLGKEYRNVGIAQVMSRANKAWVDKAYAVVVELARSGVYFSSDEVWHEMLRRYPDIDTVHHSAMGGVFDETKKDGIIIPVGHKISERPEAKGREIRTWRGT